MILIGGREKFVLYAGIADESMMKQNNFVQLFKNET